MKLYSSLTAGLSTLALLGCSEPAVGSSVGSDSGGAGGPSSSSSDSENTDGSDSTDTEAGHQLLVVEDVGWLCNTDPPAGRVLPLETVLFQSKRRMRLIPGSYDVLAGEPVLFDYIFEGVERPLVLQTPEVTVETGYWGTTTHGWHIDEEEGTTWETLKYVQGLQTDPPTMSEPQRNVVLLVSRDSDEPGVDFVFTQQLGLANYSALLGPCDPPEPTDVVRIAFEEGELTLEARKGWYASGFLMTARGNVEGIDIDVEEREDLGMYAHDIDESYFGLPTFAIRWPDKVPATAECGLVLEPDLDTGEYSAWFIDCDLQPLRDVVVEDIQVEFGE